MSIDPVCGMEIEENCGSSQNQATRLSISAARTARQGLTRIQRSSMLRVLALASLVIISLMYPKTTYAQSQGLQSVMTGAGELLIGLDISYPKDEENNTIMFIITFYHSNATDLPEEHIDYNFLILKENKTILNAAATDDSPIGIIHSVTGTEKHTFSFDDTGTYTARVVINGLRMVLVTPVYADFPVTVTPEFQLTIPVLALVIGGGIAFMRFVSLRRLRSFY